jgi:pyruvate/2-oxoglutarate dehydrogenase complex dihydrolipoamide dehydrogenase (E3) component
MSTETRKNLIIGSGEAGKYLAWYFGKIGEKSTVIERRWIGGSCPNINCLPSKNEIWSAKVADLVHHSRQFGSKAGSGTVDMAIVRERKRKMVESDVAAHMELYQQAGTELIMGEAKFTGPGTVEIKLNDGGTRTLQAERIFLNLGTHAAIPPAVADCRPLTHIEALELDRVPEHLVVLGGGYVGLEFAQMQLRFGAKVTVIQHGSQLLPNQDRDIADEIRSILDNDGIDIMTEADVVSATGQSGREVTLTVRTHLGDKTIRASHVLAAVGRIPNTAGIGLDLAGVQLDSHGFIRVNDRLQATAPNVWAMGECAGSPQFTHVSLDDFRVVRDNLAGLDHTTKDRLIPSCLFTDPQLAQIGLTETEAKRRDVVVRVVRLPTANILRTHTTSETEGFLKVLLGEGDQIVGFAMIGTDAGEVVAAAQMAMIGHLPLSVLQNTILAHPTMAEGLGVLFSRA